MRPAIALDPRHFGRAVPRASRAEVRANSPADDLRLFAMTFAAGFLFVSVLLA